MHLTRDCYLLLLTNVEREVFKFRSRDVPACALRPFRLVYIYIYMCLPLHYMRWFCVSPFYQFLSHKNKYKISLIIKKGIFLLGGLTLFKKWIRYVL